MERILEIHKSSVLAVRQICLIPPMLHQMNVAGDDYIGARFTAQTSNVRLSEVNSPVPSNSIDTSSPRDNFFTP